MSARAAITSRANPLLKRLVALKRRARTDDSLLLLEGRKLVEEALAAGLRIVEAAFAERVAEQEQALAVRLQAVGAAVRVLSDPLADSLSEAETSSGLLAIARAPESDREALFRGRPLVLAAIGLQNPGNLGGLLRSAEAAGATGALLAEGCADPFSWKALRGSMGSAFRLPLWRGLEPGAVASTLRGRGLRLLAADARGDRRYDLADYTGPVALLVGSEGSGLPEELLAAADERVAIPLAGGVESLNVGVAGALLLFEAARQRRAP